MSVLGKLSTSFSGSGFARGTPRENYVTHNNSYVHVIRVSATLT